MRHCRASLVGCGTPGGHASRDGPAGGDANKFHSVPAVSKPPLTNRDARQGVSESQSAQVRLGPHTAAAGQGGRLGPVDVAARFPFLAACLRVYSRRDRCIPPTSPPTAGGQLLTRREEGHTGRCMSVGSICVRPWCWRGAAWAQHLVACKGEHAVAVATAGACRRAGEWCAACAPTGPRPPASYYHARCNTTPPRACACRRPAATTPHSPPSPPAAHHAFPAAGSPAAGWGQRRR